MKNREFEDERVIGQKRKVDSEALGIVFYGLLLAVLIQQYVFQAPFSQYAAEITIFIAISVYIVVRNIMLGNSLFRSAKRGQKAIIINSLITGAVVAGISGIINYFKYFDLNDGNVKYTMLIFGITFFSAFMMCFIAFEILFIMNKRKQDQIDKKLSEDEN